MTNISVKLFRIWNSGSEDFSYKELWWPSCLMEQNQLGIFG